MYRNVSFATVCLLYLQNILEGMEKFNEILEVNARYPMAYYGLGKAYIRMNRLVLSHYENTPIQIYRTFHLQKMKIFRYRISDIFHISAQNIDEAVLMSNHNLCFWAEIRKIMYTPVNPSFPI